jgi:NAD-dependent dihydropyrimidine dehydrogenase PreA subunit
MTYVIAEPCTGVKDKAGAGECPADCICEGDRMLCIHPGERVDRGGCEPVCPARAIFCEDDMPGQWAQFTAQNAKFSGQLGSAGGAAKTGPLPYDTDYVASYVTGRNATMSVRRVPGRGRASGGPAPGSPPARAASPASG